MGTRRIGLSLGADSCWPVCFEELVSRLNPELNLQGEIVRFEVERVMIEPFDLRQKCPYDLVVDRLTHWYHTSREWIKKSVVMDDLYVFNNPWSLQSMEKQTTYCAMMRLGFPVPDTWMIPPKAYQDTTDLRPTLERYARLFDVDTVGEKLGYPVFMKPYDGGGWTGVSRVEGSEELKKAYEESGTSLMHVQKGVVDYDLFVRCVAVGPQVRVIKYDPSAALHERYQVEFEVVDAEDAQKLRDTTLTINAFFGWDFNSCEAIRKDGVFHPFDFANACPDSQVTSLHYHFPWLVTSKVKWALFCAATRRKMRLNLNWDPYYAISNRELPFEEKLVAFGRLAEEHFETERFNEFCEKHLAGLDEVAYEFFGSDVAREAIRGKVAALFPEDEVETFTEHFWGLIQFWRKTEADRLGAVGGTRDSR